MSNVFWWDWLNHRLAALRKNDTAPRVAVVGIGHELRGDDNAGLIIAQSLKQRLTDQQHIMIVEGGSAPENYTAALRRFAPVLVLLIDAADMNEPPGSVRWLLPETTRGLSASTHTLPLSLLAKYLHLEMGCEVTVIGIQPAQMAMGSALSPEARTSVSEIVCRLATALSTGTC